MGLYREFFEVRSVHACGSAEGRRPGTLQKDKVNSSHGIAKAQQDLPFSLDTSIFVLGSDDGWCQALEDICATTE